MSTSLNHHVIRRRNDFYHWRDCFSTVLLCRQTVNSINDFLWFRSDLRYLSHTHDNAVDIRRVGAFWLICHWSGPTHNSTSEFLQLTSSPSCCRTLATSAKPPRRSLPASYYLLLPPPSASLPASGGSPARGGWVTLSHQLHCLHPDKHHKNINPVIECDSETKCSWEGWWRLQEEEGESRMSIMLSLIVLRINDFV